MCELSIGCFFAAEALHPQPLTHAEALHFQPSAVPSALLCQNYTLTLQKVCFQGSFFFFFSFSGVIFFLFNRGGVKQDYRSMAVLKRNCMVLPLVQFVQNPEQRTVCLWLWLPVNAGSPGLPFKKRKENKNKVGGGVAVGTSVEDDAQAP